MAASQLAESDLSQGLRLHHQGHLDGAARHYEAVLTRDPDDPDAICLLGMVRHQQGELTRAVELIGRAVALRPDRPGYHASLGLALQAMGRPAESAAAFANLLALCPDDAAGHVNRGVAMRALGEREAALAHFRRAVALDGGLAEAHANLAALLVELGRPREALPHCHAAVAARPDLAEARIALGDAFRALQRPLDARAAYSHALRIDPGRAGAAAGLGLAAIALELWDEGLIWLRRAVELEPNSLEYLRSLAEAAMARGRHDELRACCERVLELDPTDGAASGTLGWCLHLDGRRDEARLRYEEAIRLCPDLAQAHFYLGLLLEEVGEPADAEARFREAVRLDPGHATALARLASMVRGKLPDDETALLESRLLRPDLPAMDRMNLLFASGEVLDGRGDYPAAAARFAQANAVALEQLVQGGRAYDPSEHRRFIDATMANYTPELFARLAGAGLETRRPVFVIGLPRSGTTLIEQILASHPSVFGAGEIALARESHDEIPALLGRDGPPECLVSRLTTEHLAELARRHERRLAELDGGDSARIINKMPENFFYLGLIAAMFPNAAVIHCRRDLRDVALSCWMANFVEVRWSNDFDLIAGRFAEYLRLMDHWAAALPASFAVHAVRYEDAVDDIEGVARRLVAAIGLEWDPACLGFHRNRRPVQTASQNQVRRPIYRTSIGRWKNYENELAGLFARVADLPGQGAYS